MMIRSNTFCLLSISIADRPDKFIMFLNNLTVSSIDMVVCLSLIHIFKSHLDVLMTTSAPNPFASSSFLSCRLVAYTSAPKCFAICIPCSPRPPTPRIRTRSVSYTHLRRPFTFQDMSFFMMFSTPPIYSGYTNLDSGNSSICVSTFRYFAARYFAIPRFISR